MKYRISIDLFFSYYFFYVDNLSWADDLTHSFPQVEVKKAQTEEQTLGESPASAKATPLIKDTKPDGRQGLKPAGVLTHINYNCRNTIVGIQYLNVQQHNTVFFPFQCLVPQKFQKGLVRTDGYGKMCCHLQRPRHHHQCHQLCSPRLTAASRPGWNWQKESQWPGVISPWTEQKNRQIYCCTI